MSIGMISGQSPWRRVRRVVTGTDPAAGAEWTETVPAGVVWDLISVLATLVTDATVADRSPRLRIGDGASVFLDVPPVAVQAASITGRYLWGRGLTGTNIGAGQAAGIPDLRLPAGSTIASLTGNLQAADNWGAPVLYVVETAIRGASTDLSVIPDAIVQVVSPGLS